MIKKEVINMTRAEIKTQAKQVLANNYWPCIGAFVLVSIILSAVSGMTGFIGGIGVFFVLPAELGLIIYFTCLSDGMQTGIGDIFTKGFDGRYYLRRVGGYAWMTLFTFLWSLLFVIPGIVKGYSYALTPYILAKYPEIPAKEALKLSMKIMNGRKSELFVLDLSFIGWFLLSGITFGLVGIFFVFPYYYITRTLWFKNAMKEVTDSGEFTYSPVIEM